MENLLFKLCMGVETLQVLQEELNLIWSLKMDLM